MLKQGGSFLSFLLHLLFLSFQRNLVVPGLSYSYTHQSLAKSLWGKTQKISGYFWGAPK